MSRSAVDPYATLGIPVDASRAAAARAHRRLAKRYHPDVNAGPEAADRMRRINEAWRILSDPARRARYDADRAVPRWPGPGYSAGSGAASGTASWASSGSATWTAWPDGRRTSVPRTRRPARPDPVEPSFGDRPAVFIAVWVVLAVLFFVGSWLGSIGP